MAVTRVYQGYLGISRWVTTDGVGSFSARSGRELCYWKYLEE